MFVQISHWCFQPLSSVLSPALIRRSPQCCFHGSEGDFLGYFIDSKFVCHRLARAQESSTSTSRPRDSWSAVRSLSNLTDQILDLHRLRVCRVNTSFSHDQSNTFHHSYSALSHELWVMIFTFTLVGNFSNHLIAFFHCSNNQASITVLKIQMLADSSRLRLDAQSCAVRMCAFRNCQYFGSSSSWIASSSSSLSFLQQSVLVISALALDRRCSAAMFRVYLHRMLCFTC